MPTAALTGRLGSIRSSTNAASTATTSQTVLGALRNYSITVDRDVIDITNHDSSGWFEGISGIARWRGTADLVYVSTGLQGGLRRVELGANPGALPFTFKQSTSNTAKKYQGKAFITSFEVNHQTDNAVLGTIAFVGHTALVRTS